MPSSNSSFLGVLVSFSASLPVYLSPLTLVAGCLLPLLSVQVDGEVDKAVKDECAKDEETKDKEGETGMDAATTQTAYNSSVTPTNLTYARESKQFTNTIDEMKYYSEIICDEITKEIIREIKCVCDICDTEKKTT